MNLDLGQDVIFSHSLLNYLNAGYQGEFAFYNVLSQLSSEQLEREDIAETKQAIEKISKWVNELKKGVCLFNANWVKPETFNAKNALDYFGKLRTRLDEASRRTGDIWVDSNLAENPEDTIYLLASYGRYAYSKDNYVRGFIEYGQVFNIPDIVADYTAQLDDANETIRVAHMFLDAFKQSREQPEEFYYNLRHICSRLSGLFKTYVHDINQLLGQFEGHMNYQKIGMSPQEAAQWQQLQIPPQIAGYWHAFNIPPAEASAWGKIGVKYYMEAVDWILLDFDPQNAAPWHRLGFTPELAAVWGAAGYDPQSAKEYIDDGVIEPSQIKNRL